MTLPSIEHVFELPENTLAVGSTGYHDRPVGIRLEGGGRYRFQRLSAGDALAVAEALRQVLGATPRHCALCGAGEDEVRAFFAAHDGAVRICDACITEAAELLAALPAADAA